MTIDEALAMYLMQLEADGRSAHTRKQYERHVRLLTRVLGDVDVGGITHVDIARFLVSPVATHGANGTPKKATTVNAIRSSLRTWFGWLHAAGVIPSNPARLIRRAICSSPPPRALSQDEQRRLLAVLGASNGWAARRDRVLFELMLRTGIRLASALALDIRDVDLERAELTLRQVKGDRVQVVFLGADVRGFLASYMKDSQVGPLFVSRHGRRVSARQAQRRLRLWLQQGGITGRIAPHSFRHAFAGNLYTRTRDVLLVKAALGHSSILSTTKYLRATDDSLRAALS